MENELVKFNLASPYAAELADIERRNRMAQVLQQQALAPTERYSYNGIEARVSPLSGLAKALQGYTGMMMEKKGLEEQKALGERYKGERSADISALVKGLQGQVGTPERAAMLDPQEMQQAADQGTTAEYRMPAVAARAAGEIDPAMIDQLKTPEAQNQALAMYMAQLAPKTPLILGEGQIAYDPRTKQELFRGGAKSPFANVNPKDYTPESMKAFSLSVASGKPDFTVLREAISADKAATLKQEREISDRAFEELSANQKAQYRIDAAKVNQTAQEFFFNSGLKGVTAPTLPPAIPSGIGLRQPPAAVPGQPPAGTVPQAVTPPVPQARPAIAPAQRPGIPVPQAPAMVSQTGAQTVPLTGKSQQAVAVEQAKGQNEARQALPGIQLQAKALTNVIDQMIGKDVNGTLIGEHKGLRDVIGSVKPDVWINSKYASEDTRNFVPLLEQVKGGAFLQAVQQMKGSGAISEIEGTKATSALLRASNAQTPEAFIKAMQEFRSSITSGVDIARQKAGLSSSRGASGDWRDL